MTNPEFNLIENGRIPIPGECDPQSLREVFTRKELKGLGGNPVEKIVILRLLMAIVHAAVELPDRKAWLELTPEKLATQCLAYLEHWHDRFNLYGKKPFLQFLALAKGEAKPISNTLVEVSSNSNLVLSSWNVALPESDYDDAFRVRVLLRQSCFRNARGGTIKHPEKRKYAGIPGTLLGNRGNDGGYLHSYLLGDTLWETVRNNLLCEDEISELNVFTGGIGRPFWEEMPISGTCSRADELLSTYQGQLFPLDKFLLLKDDCIVITEGIKYLTESRDLVDPALTFWGHGKDRKELWCSTEKKPWRELVALLGFFDVRQGRKTPWLLYCGIAKQVKSGPKAMVFWVGGIRVSSNSGEQYLSGTDDYVESQFRIQLSDDMASSLSQLGHLIKTIDFYSDVLSDSINNYLKELLPPSKNPKLINLSQDAKRKYWELIEPHSQRIVELAFSDKVDSEDGIVTEQNLWQQIVFQIYNESCPNITARQLTAWVKCAPNFKKKEGKKNGK